MKNIDWQNLGFEYMNTGSFVKVSYNKGRWQPIILCNNNMINIHIAATALHYGQCCFEGIKAFTLKNGTIAIFRPDENGLRLGRSAQRILMEPPPLDVFMEAVNEAVKKNIEYVPPYGTGASLYIRPLLIGTTPLIGLQPSREYDLYIIVMPVGAYYKDGLKPIKGYVQENFDRAAPKGVGNVKVAGNYAAGLMSDLETKKKGYQISLFLDAETHTYIDEFSTSNFFGITADNKYVTPNSRSVLPSITNMTLQQLATDFGYTVEKRPVRIDELNDFIEVAACGTAAVITPLYSITFGDKKFTFGDKDKAGEMTSRLFSELHKIQYGDIDDRHGWMFEVK